MERERVRSSADFHTLGEAVDDIDHELCEMSTRMIEAQTGKLIDIEGDLWIASRPPAWRVSVTDNGSVHLDLAIVVDGFDPLLSRRHFPLNELERAREYARLCLEKDKPTTALYRIVEFQGRTATPSYTYDFSGRGGDCPGGQRGSHAGVSSYLELNRMEMSRNCRMGESNANRYRSASAPPSVNA